MNILHLHIKNRAPFLPFMKVSQAGLKTPAAPSSIPKDQLTSEVSLPPSLLSTDAPFAIKKIIFNLSHMRT